MERLHNIINILLTGVHQPRISILLFQTAMVNICKQVCHDLDLLSSFYKQLFTFVYVIAGFYDISNVRYPYYEFNATVYPAYIDIINYHECKFFVWETLYINVCI